MTELTDLSETDASNTTITSINIGENCNPSGINNAIRNVLGLIRRAFKSSIFRLRDSTDQTKLLAFDLSGIATGETRTVTVPNSNVNLGLVGGVWQTLGTVSASNSTQVVFTDIPAGAKVVEFYLDNVAPVTDSANLQIRTSANNGSSYDSGASDYDYSQFRGTDSGGSGTLIMAGAASQNSIVLTGPVGNSTGEAVSGTVTLHNPGLSSRTMLNFELSGVNATPAPFSTHGGGNRRSSAAVNAVQFTFLTGNINTGVFTCRYFL